ncbi:unnamed protein product [Rotaria sp. Silwood1]|nr:unnamed protein product [Rotaria sp. Silwood1]
MSSEKNSVTQIKPTIIEEDICGGISKLQPLNEEDFKIWNMYKQHLEKKIQDQFKVPTSHTLKSVQVATQVVAGMNYFFKVELPDKKYATACVYHIEWKQETHGKEDQVTVHAKLSENPNEDMAVSIFESCDVDIIEGFCSHLINLSAAADSIVILINEYDSRTISNLLESNEYKLQYVTH